MTRPSGAVFDVSIVDEEENVYDERAKGLVRKLLTHFNGYHDVFYVDRSNSTRCRPHICTPAYQHSLMALRLQYLYLFILHYPVTGTVKSVRTQLLYREFVDGLTKLEAQIEDGEYQKYVATTWSIIHLSDLLAAGMKHDKITWYKCFRCGTASEDPRWTRNPIIKCLSEVQVAAVNVVAQYVGLPTHCYCKTKIYHLLEDLEDET